MATAGKVRSGTLGRWLSLAETAEKKTAGPQNDFFPLNRSYDRASARKRQRLRPNFQQW